MADDTIKIGLSIVSDAGTKKTLSDLADVRKRIADLKNEFKSGAKDTDTFTKELSDLEKEARKLDKALDAVGEKRRINIDSGALEEAADGASFGQKLTRAGGELRKLPSVQIPGLGVGTDSIANIARVGGAAIDKLSASMQATKTAAEAEAAAETALGVASTAAAPGIGASALAFGAIAAPVLLVVGALAALGLAFKSFADDRAKEAETVTNIINANKDVRKEIDEGATTEDLQKELDKLTAARKRETDQIEQNKKVFDENFTKEGFVDVGALALSQVDDALAASTDAAATAAAGYDAKINSLTSAIDSGAASANDAAEAEKKLAEERTKALLNTAAAAGQEIDARNRADKATGDQNEARLQAIDDEKEAVSAQLAVLQASGDTSDQVASQIEKLTGQLGALGKESAYIKNTALEASKARDAEKKAQKDAEDAAKKAETAQNKYNDSIKNANRTFTNAVQDNGTKLRQTLADNSTGLLRDVTDLATKFRRDTLDLDVKSQRAERDALVDHYRSLEDIQGDAQKSREEALQSGDFKAAFLAQKAGAEALKDEQKQSTRKAQDRARSLTDERGDLLQNAQRERADRLVNYERQNADSRQAAQRDLAQARLNQQRSLQVAQEGYDAELQLLGGYLGNRQQMIAAADAKALQSQKGLSGSTLSPSTLSNNMLSAPPSGLTTISRVIRK